MTKILCSLFFAFLFVLPAKAEVCPFPKDDICVPLNGRPADPNCVDHLAQVDKQSCTFKLSGCFHFRNKGATAVRCDQSIDPIGCWCPNFRDQGNNKLADLLAECGTLSDFSQELIVKNDNTFAGLWRSLGHPKTVISCVRDVHRFYEDLELNDLRSCLSSEKVTSSANLTNCLGRQIRARR